MIVLIELAKDISCLEFQDFLVKLQKFVTQDDVRPVVRDIKVEQPCLIEVKG